MFRSSAVWVLVGAILALSSASARSQILNSNVGKNQLQQNAEQLKGKGAAAFGAAWGFTVAPGLVITPSGYSEIGRDTNPDQLVTDDPTAFGRIGAKVNLVRISEKFAANVTASGSVLRLGNNDFRTDRWEGGVLADMVYAIAPGLSISGGGLFGQDETDLVADRTVGAYAELSYRDELSTSFLRVRHQVIEYLNSIEPPSSVPESIVSFFSTTAFNSTRQEISAGLLVGNESWVAPYAELSAARVDYTREPDETVVDRDGGDYFAKGGLRVTLSPVLQADLGWRWNWRNLQDADLGSFDSNYFDASIAWRPWQFFSLSASFDRKSANHPLHSPVSQISRDYRSSSFTHLLTELCSKFPAGANRLPRSEMELSTDAAN